MFVSCKPGPRYVGLSMTYTYPSSSHKQGEPNVGPPCLLCCQEIVPRTHNGWRRIIRTGDSRFLHFHTSTHTTITIVVIVQQRRKHRHPPSSVLNASITRYCRRRWIYFRLRPAKILLHSGAFCSCTFFRGISRWQPPSRPRHRLGHKHILSRRYTVFLLFQCSFISRLIIYDYISISYSSV